MVFTRPDAYLFLGALPMPAVKETVIGGAPDFLDGLKALVISDVHYRGRGPVREIVSLAKELNCDIAFYPGDFGEDRESCGAMIALLGEISCPLGAFAVPGNNDACLYPGEMHRFRKLLAEHGITPLVNRDAYLKLPGGVLAVGGTDEHLFGTPDTSRLFSRRADCRVLLSHYPVRPEVKCDLMISGHTHGGQFNFLGVTPYTVGFESALRPVCVKGLKKNGDALIYTSPGIGMSRIPVRIGARPEIGVLRFERSAGKRT